MKEDKDRLEQMLRDLPVAGASPDLRGRILRDWHRRQRARPVRYVLGLAAVAAICLSLALLWPQAHDTRASADQRAAIRHEYDNLRQEMAAVQALLSGETALVRIDDLPGYEILLSLDRNTPNAQPICFYRGKSRNQGGTP